MNNEYINQCNNMINSLKKEIQEQIDEEYTDYKIKCLKDLDYQLECKRNECVKRVLDGIDIVINSNEPYSFDPTILIKIEKKVVIKGDN